MATKEKTLVKLIMAQGHTDVVRAAVRLILSRIGPAQQVLTNEELELFETMKKIAPYEL